VEDSTGKSEGRGAQSLFSDVSIRWNYTSSDMTFQENLLGHSNPASQFTYLYYALKVYSFCEEKIHTG